MHDLTPLHHPELCNAATLAYPGLIRGPCTAAPGSTPTPSFVAAEVVEAFGADPPRVRAVHPGIPRPPAVADAPAARVLSQVLPPGVERYCLAVGTAEPRKDLPGLVRAFGDVAERPRDVALVLAGPPGWGERGAGRGLLASTVRQRIVRTGWVEPECWRAAVTRAALLAYPSLYEGFGFPPLQAMPAGVPSSRPGPARCPRCSGTARSWSSLGDHDGLAAALDACLTTSKLRRRLRRPRGGPAPPCSRGSAVATGSRRSTATHGGRPWLRHPVGAHRRRAAPARRARRHRHLRPRAAWAVWRLRRRRATPLELTLLASRAPAAHDDPLAAFGRPLHHVAAPGPLLTRAWDHGLFRAPAGFDVVHSVSLAAPRSRGGPARAGWS